MHNTLPRFSLIVFLWLALSILPAAAQQVSAPCGVVDSIDYPIDKLVSGYDDFGLYRQRFGGNHVGIDIGFDRWGDPVYAAARGRVTYADPEGWDTEKGVVIIEHTFPDGSIIYSLYGHVEQTDTIVLPQAGTCIERGFLVGTIGWPSRGRPHLHYEIRNFLPFEGGPGYVTGNPVEAGWFAPLDFTALWRIRLTAAYRGHLNLDRSPTLPPISLDSGGIAIASGDSLSALYPTNQTQWRVKTDSAITALVTLPGDIVVAQTEHGQVHVLQSGNYLAVWVITNTIGSLAVVGDQLVFASPAGALSAYDLYGVPRWSLNGIPDSQVVYWGTNGLELALAVQTPGSVTWRLLDSAGQLLSETPLNAAPIVTTTSDGAWLVLDGTALLRFQNGTLQTRSELATPLILGEAARLTSDETGNTYLFANDSQNNLLSLDNQGDLRWQVTYPRDASGLTPLLQANACWLYTLDADGLLNVFGATGGILANQIQLYPGGRRNGHPSARLLRLSSPDQLQVGAGFLTLFTLNANQLTAQTTC